jgi:hypothetical protein
MRTPYQERLFNAYRNFNQVAYNPNNTQHQRLAQLGITVENAFSSFKKFYAWVESNLGPQPGPEYKIIRKNHLKGFTPSNLAWGVSEEVAIEQYRDKRIAFKGKKLNISRWAKEFNVPHTMLYSRRAVGITKPKELLAPPKRKKAVNDKKKVS